MTVTYLGAPSRIRNQETLLSRVWAWVPDAELVPALASAAVILLCLGRLF